jgi:hypothetical protein
VRKYVLAYATEHDLLGAAISDETLTKALADIIQDTAFPVELAKSTSVVKAVLLGTRFTAARRSRSQSQATEAPDERLGALDSEEGDVAVTHCKKRKSRSTSSVAVGDDGDNDMDHQAPNNKRKRKGRSMIRRTIQKMQKESSRHLWDSNPQSLPPESNALPLGQGARGRWMTFWRSRLHISLHDAWCSQSLRLAPLSLS